MQAFARYIMRGRLQAILVAAAAAMLSLLLPPLNYIGSAVVALVTLRKGWRDGLMIIAGAAAAMAAIASLTPLDPVHTVLLAGAIWLPVWILSLVLRQTISPSTTVSVAAIAGCVIIVGVYLGINDPAQTWRDIIDRLVEQAQQQNEQAAADAFGQLLVNVAPHMTGVLVMVMVMGLILSVFLGRWWQALLYNPGGFGREFKDLRLSRMFASVALGTLVVSMAASGWIEEVAANAMIVIGAVYLLHGLGLVHAIVATKGIHVGWLISVYAVTLVFPFLGMLLAAVAFMDSWMDIRVRIKPSGRDA